MNTHIKALLCVLALSSAGPAQAALCDRLPAEQGDREGQWKLGLLYFAGQGVEQDADEASRWLRLGAGKTPTETTALTRTAYTDGQ